MSKILYAIQFYSDWQCGSGLTSAADVDALAIKDRHGLPYIPGKTLKGLYHEAASILAQVTDENDWDKFCRDCFGWQTDKTSDQSDEGGAYFSDAELSNTLQQELQSDPAKSRLLLRKISSTAIEDNGQAKEHSLRKFEVVVPLKLFAQIVNCPPHHLDKMRQCLLWVKKLGTNRNRGLGRCDICDIQVKD